MKFARNVLILHVIFVICIDFVYWKDLDLH